MYKDFLSAHLPPGAFDTYGGGLGRLLAALAPALDAAHAEADELLREAQADTANELLPAWEISYGIVPDASIPFPARVTLLLTRIRARGGLSRQYFIDLAAALGYVATIGEFVPFMAGWGRCGDTVYVPEVVNVWNVKIHIDAVWQNFEAGIGRCGGRLGTYADDYYQYLFSKRFTCGVSRCGDPLASYSNSALEMYFNELKPAHTYVFFTYN